MNIILLIGFGLILGSFANAVIWRLHEQQSAKKPLSKKARQDLSIMRGRSMCIHCHHQLGALDLIPVVSYVILRGKCRYCAKPIDDTPVAELLMPALFVVSYIWWPYDLSVVGFTLGWTLFVGWVLCLVMFVILALYDFRWYVLPDRVVFPLIGLSMATVVLRASVFGGGWAVVVASLWGVVLTAGLFYLIYTISKGAWIGFGDVKLAIALGLLVGGPLNALILLFVSSLAGSLAATPMIMQGKKISGTRIPFGPFLLFGAVVVVLFGTGLSMWYTGLLVG